MDFRVSDNIRKLLCLFMHSRAFACDLSWRILVRIHASVEQNVFNRFVASVAVIYDLFFLSIP